MLAFAIPYKFTFTSIDEHAIVDCWGESALDYWWQRCNRWSRRRVWVSIPWHLNKENWIEAAFDARVRQFFYTRLLGCTERRTGPEEYFFIHSSYRNRTLSIFVHRRFFFLHGHYSGQVFSSRSTRWLCHFHAIHYPSSKSSLNGWATIIFFIPEFLYVYLWEKLCYLVFENRKISRPKE
jgi:hypothetical protein